jgi:hypothetical protein
VKPLHSLKSGGGTSPLISMIKFNQSQNLKIKAIMLKSLSLGVVFLVLLRTPMIIRASLDPVYGPREHPIMETFGYDISSNITELDTQLWDVVLQGDLNLQNISSLLTNGADPNAYDEKHQTALHRAAWKGQRLTISLLCSRGAFVDAQDAWTRTPLHFAAAFGKYDYSCFMLKPVSS